MLIGLSTKKHQVDLLSWIFQVQTFGFYWSRAFRRLYLTQPEHTSVIKNQGTFDSMPVMYVKPYRRKYIISSWRKNYVVGMEGTNTAALRLLQNSCHASKLSWA